MKKFFNKIKARVSAFDALLIATLIQAFIVAVPFVARQFHRLAIAEGGVKIGDVIWNVAFDLMVFNAILLVFVLLMKLLRKLDRWLEKKN
ncbi:MAG: hypothetical protein K6G39_07900 [Bacteroidales bacterium]|nr:hypothetical protein [Bacteroidales bacterium]